MVPGEVLLSFQMSVMNACFWPGFSLKVSGVFFVGLPKMEKMGKSLRKVLLGICSNIFSRFPYNQAWDIYLFLFGAIFKALEPCASLVTLLALGACALDAKHKPGFAFLVIFYFLALL